MGRRSFREFVGKAVWLLTVGLLFSPGWLVAQQESSSRTRPDQPAQDDEQAQTGQQPANVSVGTPPVVRELGTATPLPRRSGRFRWGGLSLGSFDFTQVFDRVSANATNTSLVGNRDSYASILQASIIYDRQFRRSRLAVQYQPRVAVVDGQVLKDFYNHRADFDLHYLISRNWSVNIRDEFQFVGNRDFYVGSYFSVDATTGNFLQDFFLSGPSQLLSNRASVGFNYTLSRRTHLSFTPGFTYVHSSPRGPFTSSQVRVYGMTTDLEHALSGRTSVGLFYNMEYSQFLGGFRDTFRQSFGGTFARLLGRGWHLRGFIAASTSTFFTQQPQQLTATGSISLVRAFRRSSLALTAARGYSFAGLVSDRYYDRGDVIYTRQLTRRTTIGVGTGFFREVDSPRRVRGEYAFGRFSYRLFSDLSWFASYAYRSQVGNGSQVSSGTRNSVLTGIMWRPGFREPY